jgi:imidazolonepropionase-like amidohydrolase
MSMSRRDFLAVLGTLAAIGGLPARPAGPAHAAGSPAGSGPLILLGTLVRGTGAPPEADMAVVVRRGRVESVQAASALPDDVALGARVLAAPGAVILPGIVNCHVHGVHGPQERRERFLLHGVTAIGDAASPMAALPRLLDSPPGRTATAACTGPMLCPPGGYPLPVHAPDHGLAVASPAQARAAVRRLADAGALAVKLAFEPGPLARPWPLFDQPTAAAICDEARRLGLVARCHVEDLGGLGPALDAGVHTVEHVPHRWMCNGTPRPVLGPDNLPVEPYRRLLERMARDRVIMTPTLDVLVRSMWNGPALYEPVRAFAAMGGRIALGNDHPYRRTGAGMPLAEMRLLRRAGLTTAQVIRAATLTAAQACGLKDRGEIAPGRAADLLVVAPETAPKADPDMIIEALAAPLWVIKDGGLVVDRSAEAGFLVAHKAKA